MSPGSRETRMKNKHQKLFRLLLSAAGYAVLHYAPVTLRHLKWPIFPRLVALGPTLIPVASAPHNPALALGMVLEP